MNRVVTIVPFAARVTRSSSPIKALRDATKSKSQLAREAHAATIPADAHPLLNFDVPIVAPKKKGEYTELELTYCLDCCMLHPTDCMELN